MAEEDSMRTLAARADTRLTYDDFVLLPDDGVQVYRPSPEGKLTRVAELSAEDDDTLTTPLLPGCGIGLRELFRPSV